MNITWGRNLGGARTNQQIRRLLHHYITSVTWALFVGMFNPDFVSRFHEEYDNSSGLQKLMLNA